jgi:hypothetical protein
VSDHPSFLLLDRASLGIFMPEVTAHLAGCAQCQTYLKSLAETTVPQRARPPRLDARSPRLRTWVATGAGALAAAAAIAIVARPTAPSSEMDLYVASKGAEAAWLYVKHGNETRLWDGKSAVAPGDRLRLKVEPGRFGHLQVFLLGSAEQAELIYSARLERREGFVLPEAWEVDDAPEPERLLIVFSQQPAPDAWREIVQGQQPKGLASVAFTLPKARR